MGDPLVVDSGEISADDLLETLHDGRRVRVRTELLGDPHEITLRWDGGTYYCDTPTRLHTHSEEAEMWTCIEEQGYSDPAP